MSFQSLIPNVGMTATAVGVGLFILSLFLSSLTSRPPKRSYENTSLAEIPVVPRR